MTNKVRVLLSGLFLLIVVTVSLVAYMAGQPEEKHVKESQPLVEDQKQETSVIQSQDQPLHIRSIEVHLEKEAGWYMLTDPHQFEVTFDLEGDWDTIEVYTVPTGTEVYKEVRLIQLLFRTPGQETFTIEDVNVDMGRVYFLIYKGNRALRSESFNIYYEE